MRTLYNKFWIGSFYKNNYSSRTALCGFKSYKFSLVSVMESANERKCCFRKVGIYLPALVFSHCQLYVALSHTRKKDNFKILSKETSRHEMLIMDRFYTKYLVDCTGPASAIIITIRIFLHTSSCKIFILFPII